MGTGYYGRLPLLVLCVVCLSRAYGQLSTHTKAKRGCFWVWRTAMPCFPLWTCKHVRFEEEEEESSQAVPSGLCVVTLTDRQEWRQDVQLRQGGIVCG
jgi:hypothetical protein